MARPQKFSEKDALQRAVEVFWKKGFNATSMQDLVEGMGVCRASLYKTFGNKEDLYEQALQAYRSEQSAAMLELPEGDFPVKEFLRDSFKAKVREVVTDRPEGCMVINATSELAAHDDRIREILLDNETRMRNWLEQLLSKGVERGELSPKTDITAKAQYLFLAYQGVTINAMTQSDPTALDAAIDTILMVIE